MRDRGRKPPTVYQSLREYGRGFVGGLIVSLPLLFAMEMWWCGFIAHSERLLAGIIATFILLLAYNRYAGMHPDDTWAEVAIGSIKEFGLGIVSSAAILWALGRFSASSRSR